MSLGPQSSGEAAEKPCSSWSVWLGGCGSVLQYWIPGSHSGHLAGVTAGSQSGQLQVPWWPEVPGVSHLSLALRRRLILRRSGGRRLSALLQVTTDARSEDCDLSSLSSQGDSQEAALAAGPSLSVVGGRERPDQSSPAHQDLHQGQPGQQGARLLHVDLGQPLQGGLGLCLGCR